MTRCASPWIAQSMRTICLHREEELRERLREQCLADAGRTEERNDPSEG